jgi:hypothetical protein
VIQLAFASGRDRHNPAAQTISLPCLIQQNHVNHSWLGQQANRQPQHQLRSTSGTMPRLDWIKEFPVVLGIKHILNINAFSLSGSA